MQKKYLIFFSKIICAVSLYKCKIGFAAFDTFSNSFILNNRDYAEQIRKNIRKYDNTPCEEAQVDSRENKSETSNNIFILKRLTVLLNLTVN